MRTTCSPVRFNTAVPAGEGKSLLPTVSIGGGGSVRADGADGVPCAGTAGTLLPVRTVRSMLLTLARFGGAAANAVAPTQSPR